jgi:hypothetical protein
VAAFKERTGAPVAKVVVLHITMPQRLHGLTQSLFAVRCDEKMNVVGHQYIGEEPGGVEFSACAL